MTSGTAQKDTATDLQTIELRLSGDILALNRLITAFVSKRIPLADFTLVRSGEETRAALLLDCPPDTARRYASLFEGMEDMREVKLDGTVLEIALAKAGGDWRNAASEAGLGTAEVDGTILAAGTPERVGKWIAVMEDEDDVLRLGPVIRPGRGG